MRRAALALSASIAVVAGLAGAAVGQTAAEEPLTFHVGTTSDMVSANPFKACCTSEYEMLLLNYNMLYGFSAEDLSPVPELTPGCEPSSDYMTWTCPIRDDVTWHDGEPLTADDIAFTYRFTLDNGLSTFADYLPYNPTFETPDDFTLVWNSEEPTLAPTVPPYIPRRPSPEYGRWRQAGSRSTRCGPARGGGDGRRAPGPPTRSCWPPGRGGPSSCCTG